MAEVSGTRISPALTVLPPHLSGVELAPNIAGQQRKAWNAGVWRPQPIEVLEVEGALVLPRGLTFRPDGAIVTGTSHLIPIDVVDAAIKQFPETLKDAPLIDEDLLLCVRPGHTCYGHVITEIFGAAWVGESVLRERAFSLLVSSPAHLTSTYSETARYAGLQSRALRNVSAPVRVRKLYVVNGFAQTEVYVSPLLAEFAHTIRRNCDAPGPAGKKLYIVRGTEDGRTVANEGEVWQLLEAKGFEKIRPESLAFPDQVRLFAQATHVLGSLGSGLANAIFCAPGGRLLTLAPAGALDTFFWRIAACVGLDYQEIRCADVGSARYEKTKRYLDRNIVVDLELLSKWLVC
jgi:capsular polysaccharide biosynthesis protein